MHRRNILQKGESYPDLQSALARCLDDDAIKHEMSRRLKANGWSKDLELDFRDDAKTVQFILPGQERKRTPVESDIAKRANACMHIDTIKHKRIQAEVKPNYMDKD